MNVLVKVLIAVVLGVLVAGLLKWAGWLNNTLNDLIGILVALIYFFGARD